tara:strand:+ start:452 stop:1582 length:1131 start_codon:yes stop_codon:yes gene_type:complete
MKICIISFGKFHAFDLARELVKNNYDVKLFSSYPYFIAKKYKIKRKNFFSFFLLQIIDRFSKRNFSYYLKFFFAKCIKLIITKKQDLFIIWSDTPSFLTKYLKNKFSSIIIIERGSSHIFHQNKILKDEYKRFGIDFNIDKRDIENEILNYEYSDFISIPSKFVYDSFINNGVNSNKLFMNQYGSNLKKFFPNKKNKSKYFIVLTVGGSTIRKGLLYVLKSHKLISNRFKHIHIGNIDDEVMSMIHLFPKFHHIKSVNQDRLREYYQKSDVLIVPSLEEGLSLTILEAMSCGLPIIATKNSGIESIESKLNFNFLIKIRDPKDIAKKINLLMNNPKLLNNMSKNSLKIISEGGFKWEDYGIRYKNFINEIKNNHCR